MRKQRGAIVVEATIALSAFIFAIFTILSVVNICFIQAKMAVALNAAAKEISQYSYLYYAFGVDGIDSAKDKGTTQYKDLATQTIDGVGTFMEALSGASGSIDSGDFDGLVKSIKNGATNVDGLINAYADKLKDDPKGFIIGMGKMATAQVIDDGKAILAQVLAKTFMQKNLMSSADDDADAFLRRHNVEQGMDGLDFAFTTFLSAPNPDEIQLVVTYDIQVIKLLNIDYKFRIRQCSKTTAWGNGVSLLPKAPPPGDNGGQGNKQEQTVWDMPSTTQRGKIIVEEERKNYDYVSDDNGFDAYNNENGENEFISITTVDTSMSSYQTADGIEARLAAVYYDMYDKVSHLGDEIELEDQNGNTVTVPSDPETRTYEIVLVVPDDADLAVVEEAIRQFQEAHPGVEVTVRQGYGGHTEPDPEPIPSPSPEPTPEVPETQS